MKVLVACEFSGIVRDAFIARGHDAISCDLLPTERPGPHIRGDVLDLLEEGWDLLIAHPPCTYLANSGVRWLYGGKGTTVDVERWSRMSEGAELFAALLSAGIPRVAVENPVMHRYGRELIEARTAVAYDRQIIQPWQFGHGEVKATCLWLKNLPPLQPTNVVDGREARVHRMPPGPERWKERSRTLQGIADAMADQWGGVLDLGMTVREGSGSGRNGSDPLSPVPVRAPAALAEGRAGAQPRRKPSGRAVLGL